jgi:hypothetical protein
MVSRDVNKRAMQKCCHDAYGGQNKMFSFLNKKIKSTLSACIYATGNVHQSHA